MSINVMSLVFKAKIGKIKVGNKTVTAPILKFILIALADHCNDDGDGAYPGLDKLEKKTALTHQSVINALAALTHQGLIIRVGISKKYGTTNYSLNVPMLKSLVHLVDYPTETSQPGLRASKPDCVASQPGCVASQPDLPESYLTVLKPSFNQEEENQKNPQEFSYWDTLLEIIQSDRDIPRTCKAKIFLGKPVSFQDGILTISHPEAEWCNQRFSRMFTNMIQGLSPGAAVQFTP